jgi:glycosyltransferase involved in cell wall biosynthesis
LAHRLFGSQTIKLKAILRLDLLEWVGMQLHQNASVSIVIPVYNEADQLAACLRAIADQTSKPLEVIVVDNNSTDGSAAIAAGFPFVRVLSEPRQGVVHARNRGFDAARGDIIGRIDADSLIAPNWVATLDELFTDPSLSLVTGKMHYYGLSLSWLIDAVDLRIRRRMARLLGREVAAQGANMALRRSSWQDVRDHLCFAGGLHEDYDLAIHLAERGELVRFDERLEVAISFRQADSPWRAFCVYAWLSPKTYGLHQLKSRRHMYPIVGLVIICYPLLKALHRGYDPVAERFSWRQLAFATATPRVNPATFVD